MSVAYYMNPYSNYRKTSVETATPEKLLLMLFDGAIKFSRQAKQELEKGNIAQAHEFLIKTQNILSELHDTVDIDAGEVAKNLKGLYAFYRLEVVKANVQKDAKLLGPVIDFLVDFRTMWEEAAKLAKNGEIHEHV